MTLRFPNLYLIGAPKAGTTFLHAQLSKSPQIFSARNKEPSFFLRRALEYTLHGPQRKKLPLLAESRDIDSYLALYKDWGEEAYGIDASTYYLSGQGVAQRIAQEVPQARIVAVLREPISRTYSHYLMELRDGWLDGSLEFAIDQELEEIKSPEIPWGGHYSLIRNSLYYDGLESFYEHFGPSRMRVYLFEDIKNAAEAVLEDISMFLSIDILVLEETEQAKNAYAADRFPALTRLINMYRGSRLRDFVNCTVPRRIRDYFREGYDKLRLRKQKKPVMSERERRILTGHLGDDYKKSLAFAREKGILFESLRKA